MSSNFIDVMYWLDLELELGSLTFQVIPLLLTSIPPVFVTRHRRCRVTKELDFFLYFSSCFVFVFQPNVDFDENSDWLQTSLVLDHYSFTST